jgi:ATP-binding protein involved in chromosome partitioning
VGGGLITAERLATGLLGQVPLLPGIREGGDRGQPVVVGDPQGEAAKIFRGMAEKLLEQLERASARPTS